MKVMLLVSVVLVLFALIFPVAAAWDSAPAAPAPESPPSEVSAPASDGGSWTAGRCGT